MKNINISIIGITLMFNGLLFLVLMASMRFMPFGLYAIILVFVGIVIILYAMIKPLTNEDFTEEEIQKMTSRFPTKVIEN